MKISCVLFIRTHGILASLYGRDLTTLKAAGIWMLTNSRSFAANGLRNHAYRNIYLSRDAAASNLPVSGLNRAGSAATNV
jgi:hypothetical protein